MRKVDEVGPRVAINAVTMLILGFLAYVMFLAWVF